MFGPILSLEWLLGSRRGRLDALRRVYAGWLVFQFDFFFLDNLLAVLERRRLRAAGIGGGDAGATGRMIDSYVETFLAQHFLLLALVTPAFVAGAMTDEKVRRTLSHLLAADLTSWDIVLGKWLGRLAQVGVLALAGLPFLALVAGFGQLGVGHVLVVAGLTVVVMAGLGAVCILASVRSTQTREAVLRVYAWAVAGGVLAWAFHEWVGSAFARSSLASWPATLAALLWLDGAVQCLNPVYVLGPAWGGGGSDSIIVRLAQATAAWGVIGIAALGLAAWHLRPAYSRQLESAGRKRRLIFLGRRRPVTDDPIAWKEREAGGLVRWAGFRRPLQWLGVAAVLGWAVHVTLAQVSHGYVVLTVADLSVPLLVSAIAGVRSSGAVCGERERQTWDALLLTPLETQEIIRGKLRGVLSSVAPYFVAYAAPAFAISLFDLRVLCWKVPMLATFAAVTYFVSAIGIWWSVRSSSSWRSLLATLATGYGYGTVIYVVTAAASALGAALAAAVVGFLVWVLMLLLVQLRARDFQLIYAPVWYGLFTAGPVFVFWTIAERYLENAERWVADRERIGNSLTIRVARAINKRLRLEIDSPAVPVAPRGVSDALPGPRSRGPGCAGGPSDLP